MPGDYSKVYTLQLDRGRQSSLLRHHPWIFSGAIKRVQGLPEPGATVRVTDSGGNFQAWAAWSPSSQIRARVWSFTESEAIDADFFRRRIRQACQRRAGLLGQAERNACRLIFAESDGLPGLIVDRYADYLSCQFLTTGVEYWKQEIVAALAEEIQAWCECQGIYERSDVSVRAREGLPQQKGVLWGKEPPALLEINEAGRRIAVSLCHGHKTGFYLDQYDNREIIRQLSSGRSVLNCFSYTGSFALAALQGNARQVLNIDSSAPALDLAEHNRELNQFAASQWEQIGGNVFEVLRDLQESGRQFDLIILDPPKFADTRSQLNKAARAYKDIALQAAALLTPGGLLATFSCSGAVEQGLFQKITADALLDAGREGQILRFLQQAEDHPVALPFPEAFYLKGLLCRVD
ncbi:MAG: class I SAM-dependent methyltransferase [Pseudomonadales bacterium]|nr:class I SAM-dependent methyltransferase [Pseudomonadales bacterium]